MKVIKSKLCKDCLFHSYTENSWFCKKVQLDKYTYRKIDDTDKIHELFVVS